MRTAIFRYGLIVLACLVSLSGRADPPAATESDQLAAARKHHARLVSEAREKVENAKSKQERVVANRRLNLLRSAKKDDILMMYREFEEKEAARNKPPEMSLLTLTLGQVGQIKHGILAGFVFDSGFVGQLNITNSADDGRYKSHVVVIRGVDTSNVVSGQWVRLSQTVKVSRTERLSNGDTVLVVEPADPAQTGVLPSEPVRGADGNWRRVTPVDP